MSSDFLHQYQNAFQKIPGWQTFDAALLFMLYHSALPEPRDVLEIGALHGLSAIGVGALRGSGRTLWIIEPYGLPGMSSAASENALWQNLNEFGIARQDVRLIKKFSRDVSPSELDGAFSFCHVDGDHSAKAVFDDLELVRAVLEPGGLAAMDDFLNPRFPGVHEAVGEYLRAFPGAFKPIAFGFNKLMLQKTPAPFDLQAHIESAYPALPHTQETLWRQPAALYISSLVEHFDLARSTPHKLVMTRASQEIIPPQKIERADFFTRVRRAFPRAAPRLAAHIQALETHLELAPHQETHVLLQITNLSPLVIKPGSAAPLHLSYHLLNAQGNMLRYDNARTFFPRRIEPGQTDTVGLVVQAPAEIGNYILEADIVWEGVTWFQDWGSRTAHIPLRVANQ